MGAMTDDVSWVPVVAAADVTGPPWACHDVSGVLVRLLRDADGGIHAVQPSCPHLEAPLDHAEIEGDTVLCPRHWYGYDLRSGENVTPGWRDLPLVVHPVRVVDGIVHVALEPGR